MKCVRTVFAPRPFASVCLCVLIPASATNTCLKPHFNASPPLGSRFERATQVIGGAGGSLARFRTSDHRLRCAACPSALAAACRRHEAAGARRKVLVVSAHARSVMTYDCAVTRMMNGGSRAHVVYTYMHTQQHGATILVLDRTNERDRGRRPIGDRRSTSGERRSPTGARGLSGTVHRGGAGLWFVILFFSGKSTISPNSKRTPQAVGRGGVGARASQVFRAGVRRNFAVGRRSGTGPESLY